MRDEEGRDQGTEGPRDQRDQGNEGTGVGIGKREGALNNRGRVSYSQEKQEKTSGHKRGVDGSALKTLQRFVAKCPADLAIVRKAGGKAKGGYHLL